MASTAIDSFVVSIFRVVSVRGFFGSCFQEYRASEMLAGVTCPGRYIWFSWNSHLPIVRAQFHVTILDSGPDSHFDIMVAPESGKNNRCSSCSVGFPSGGDMVALGAEVKAESDVRGLRAGRVKISILYCRFAGGPKAVRRSCRQCTAAYRCR